MLVAPSDARWSVMNWQSSSVKLPTFNRATSHAKATFDASAARLNPPYGIAVDGAGNLYNADLGNNRIRKVTSGGIISTVAGTDRFLAPRNVVLDAAGSLYVSEFSG